MFVFFKEKSITFTTVFLNPLMRKFYIFGTIFCFSVLSFEAQNFLRPNEWTKYRKEIIFSVGTSNFLGDLGGGNSTASNYTPLDLNLATTRPALGIGGRYKLKRWLNVMAKFDYLVVSGDDKYSKEASRRERNLNFKSNIFELSGRLEAGWQSNKRGGGKYGMTHGYSRMRNSGHSLFCFIGVGGFYFNPKGRTPEGKYVALYPLHTEGQGLPNGPKQYSRVSVCIPVGAYYKYTINNGWAIGAELNVRKTFSDYIDDVGGVYYDSTALAHNYGPLSAQMADPNIYPSHHYTRPASDGTPAVRGDNHKDWYATFEITLSYTFKTHRRSARLRSKF